MKIKKIEASLKKQHLRNKIDHMRTAKIRKDNLNKSRLALVEEEDENEIGET